MTFMDNSIHELVMNCLTEIPNKWKPLLHGIPTNLVIEMVVDVFGNGSGVVGVSSGISTKYTGHPSKWGACTDVVEIH